MIGSGSIVHSPCQYSLNSLLSLTFCSISDIPCNAALVVGVDGSPLLPIERELFPPSLSRVRPSLTAQLVLVQKRILE